MGKMRFGIRDRVVVTVCLAVLATGAITIVTQFQQERAHVDEVFAAQTRLLGEQVRPAIERADPAHLQTVFQNLVRDGGPGNEYATALSITAYDAIGRQILTPSEDKTEIRLNELMGALARMPNAQNSVRLQQDNDVIAVAAPVGMRRGFAPMGTIAIAWDARAALGSIRDNAISHAATATVAGLLVMLMVMIMLDRGAVGPLRRLQSHAAEIARSGSPALIDDAVLLARRDELGELARDFNAMIEEILRGGRVIAAQTAEIERRSVQLDTALSNMSHGLLMYNADGLLALCNDRFASMYEVPKEALRSGMTRAEVREVLQTQGNLVEVAEEERDLAGPNEVRPPAASTHRLSNGRVILIARAEMADGGWVSTFEDVTERPKLSRARATRQPDAITGLPGRAEFEQMLSEALLHIEPREVMAVLCVDLDHFQSVNDTLGLNAGDAVLEAAAGRLREALREGDILARIGDDEFAILRRGLESMLDATALARDIIKSLAAPYTIDGRDARIGASVGLAFAPYDATEARPLLKCADMALYRAKKEGRGAHRLYDRDLDMRTQARLRLELDLRTALARDEFIVLFQPLLDIETAEVGAMAVAPRWRRPGVGLVAPADFMPLAGDGGFVREIGQWVLAQTCAAARGWPEGVRAVVSLSYLQPGDRQIVEDVTQAIRAAGISPSRLEFEVSAASIDADPPQVYATLGRLRNLGASIAMDATGASPACVKILRRFTFDRIKIDRSLASQHDASPDASALVAAIAELGLDKSVTTTAEGADTVEELEALRAAGSLLPPGLRFARADEDEAPAAPAESKTAA